MRNIACKSQKNLREYTNILRVLFCLEQYYFEIVLNNIKTFCQKIKNPFENVKKGAHHGRVRFISEIAFAVY